MRTRGARFGILDSQIILVLRSINAVPVVGEVGQILTESVSKTDCTAARESPVKRREQAVITRDGCRLFKGDRSITSERSNSVDVRRRRRVAYRIQNPRIRFCCPHKVYVALFVQMVAF